jgi:hypothetical protein
MSLGSHVVRAWALVLGWTGLVSVAVLGANLDPLGVALVGVLFLLGTVAIVLAEVDQLVEDRLEREG